MKSQFYSKGVDNQKRHDIIFHIGRPSRDKMAKWDTKTQKEVEDYLKTVQAAFEGFKSEILSAFSRTPTVQECDATKS
jgi:hypothetical protein